MFSFIKNPLMDHNANLRATDKFPPLRISEDCQYVIINNATCDGLIC